MADRITTVIPSGVTNAMLGTALETYIGMDPSTVHQYFNDFDTYTSSDWTATATQSPTNGLVASASGVLSMVNSTASADLDQLTLVAASFAFVAGKQVWFKTRFQLSNATNAIAIIGLQNLNTNALAATDGAWFYKAGGATALNLVLANASTQTTSTASQTMANNTYVNAGFYYDGGASGVVACYFNDNLVGNVATTNLPAASTNLALTIALENNTAAGNTMLVDYVMAAVQRDSPSQLLGA